MAKKKRDYENNPPAAIRRTVPGVEAGIRGTSMGFGDMRVQGAPESAERPGLPIDRPNWNPEAGRMIFDSTTAGKKVKP